MTKLSWPKAKAHQQAMRAAQFDRYAQAPRPAQDWAQAKRKRQINVLTTRIENGKGWLSTIPTTDPRWAKWQRKLAQLIHQRKSLGA